MKEKKTKSVHKLFPVIKVLFGTAVKKYPLFFVLETFKMLVQVAQPFLGILVTPLLVDELCTSQNVKVLITYAAILVVGEFVLLLLLEWLNTTLQKYQERCH